MSDPAKPAQQPYGPLRGRAPVEPTYLMPPPGVTDDGKATSFVNLSPKQVKARGVIMLRRENVIPVIVVPGIMGSNLRATTDPAKPVNQVITAGAAAWRPPNGLAEGKKAVNVWKGRDAGQRQLIFDPATLDVDDGGPIPLSRIELKQGLSEETARTRGWGTVHWDSYGTLLVTLERNLNSTLAPENPHGLWMQWHWYEINLYNRLEWGCLDANQIPAALAPLTYIELRNVAQYHYPVYAFGYNWLESNAKSAERLTEFIDATIRFWKDRVHQCEQVILVTHSMGGLVARAAAKSVPDKIAGVVHGVMPALGAPAVYRRIACGTETSSPSNGPIDNVKMEKFAEIVGETAKETTPVMATAAGPLELLPTKNYPGPWLFACTNVKRADKSGKDIRNLLSLPQGNPYDLYRDMDSWYRLFNPDLVDPAKKYHGNRVAIRGAIKNAIDQAESFHDVLAGHFHPNSYVFFGHDSGQQSFGSCRWLAFEEVPNVPATALRTATIITENDRGGRRVKTDDGVGISFRIQGQDVSGDGTVPYVSGAGVQSQNANSKNAPRLILRTRGYGHQDSYSNPAMLALTQHLIARIVQSAKQLSNLSYQKDAG